MTNEDQKKMEKLQRTVDRQQHALKLTDQRIRRLTTKFISTDQILQRVLNELNTLKRSRAQQ